MTTDIKQNEVAMQADAEKTEQVEQTEKTEKTESTEKREEGRRFDRDKDSRPFRKDDRKDFRPRGPRRDGDDRGFRPRGPRREGGGLCWRCKKELGDERPRGPRRDGDGGFRPRGPRRDGDDRGFRPRRDGDGGGFRPRGPRRDDDRGFKPRRSFEEGFLPEDRGFAIERPRRDYDENKRGFRRDRNDRRDGGGFRGKKSGGGKPFRPRKNRGWDSDE